MAGWVRTTAQRVASRVRRQPVLYTPEAIAIVIALSAVPMVAGWVGPNPFYGFRTPATMASPEEWSLANRLMGWYMIGSQVLAMALMDRLAGALQARFGSDRVVWGVLCACAAVLLGMGAAVVHYYASR